jgi:hypothetical protein
MLVIYKRIAKIGIITESAKKSGQEIVETPALNLLCNKVYPLFHHLLHHVALLHDDQASTGID